jgi:hypothetical protein
LLLSVPLLMFLIASLLIHLTEVHDATVMLVSVTFD